MYENTYDQNVLGNRTYRGGRDSGRFNALREWDSGERGEAKRASGVKMPRHDTNCIACRGRGRAVGGRRSGNKMPIGRGTENGLASAGP